MIAVIADDFTGAAEIGGIAVRLGWKVVINTIVAPEPGTDVLIIATNTRSKEPEEARSIIRQTTSELMQLQPQLIYKKIDSVLRGNVSEELLEQIAVSGKKRALLVPANPSLKRIIQDGVYYFEGAPLHRSRFSTNSRDGVKSSNVVDLIGNGKREDTDVISIGDDFTHKSLIIGNAVNEEDLDHWAARLDDDTVLAGGSSFFHALLRHLGKKNDVTRQQLNLGKRILYVCGSAFQGSRSMVANAFDSGKKVAYMPAEMFCEAVDRSKLINAWQDTVTSCLETNDSVIIAVDQINSIDAGKLDGSISEVIADVVRNTMQYVDVDELVIEGGETASVIMSKLNYNKFFPVQELSPGVIRMKIKEKEGIHLTLKPGSYVWPSSIWQY
ncbi:four-carbon acid sugar kinase family protein [Arcticibacter sp.]|uniref:four-carbon acid sugar kinase family protein n=1 Tax=Arcticibacter sp. TaxID=1872630 RepID=UPI00388FA602